MTHTAFVAEQTIEYLERRRNDAFLCIAGFYSPHEPWVTRAGGGVTHRSV